MRRLAWNKITNPSNAYHVARVRLYGHPSDQEHTQDFHEVFWVEDGIALHRINGVETRIGAGSMVFIRSMDRHGLGATDARGVTLVNIAFPKSIINTLGRNYFQSDRRWFWSRAAQPDSVSLDINRLNFLSLWVTRLIAAVPRRLEIDLFLMELLRDLSEMRGPTHSVSEPAWLTAALRRIDEPVVMASGTAGLARIARRTPQHLNATVMKFRGQTATAVLNEGRMRYAMRELRIGSKEILEICFDCGLENVSHFYKLFHNATGMTPKQYRSLHRKLLW